MKSNLIESQHMRFSCITLFDDNQRRVCLLHQQVTSLVCIDLYPFCTYHLVFIYRTYSELFELFPRILCENEEDAIQFGQLIKSIKLLQYKSKLMEYLLPLCVNVSFPTLPQTILSFEEKCMMRKIANKINALWDKLPNMPCTTPLPDRSELKLFVNIPLEVVCPTTDTHTPLWVTYQFSN